MANNYDKDEEARLLALHKQAVGHLCFECGRLIEKSEVTTISFTGSMPIFHHSACFFPEDKLQEIVDNSSPNKLIYD